MKGLTLIRIFLIMTLLLQLVFAYVKIFIIFNGGVILYAHPLLPPSDWGQENMRTPVIEAIISILCLSYVICYPKRDKINEVNENGKR